MRNASLVLWMMIFILSTANATFAGTYLVPPGPMDPKNMETVHMAIECDTFTPGKPDVHLPGADLAGPGDVYRYTIIRDDKFAKNPNYEVFKALVGIHIDDYDASKDGGDKAPEWCRILINGKSMSNLIMLPFDKRKPESTDLLEVTSDLEYSPNPDKLWPPYIFNVTELFKQGNSVVFEITNVRKDGSLDSNAPFGNFVVNRIGCHVWYKKK